MTPGKTVRAASYCRLSLAIMGDTTKVDDQDAINHKLAAHRGWSISPRHVYKDNSRSAWKRNRRRPGWDAMLTAVDAGELDAIIVYHGDRLIRQPRDLEDLLDIASARGVMLLSPTGEYNLADPDHRMMLRWMAARAVNEVDNISRRMKEGHRRRREAGRVRAGGRGGRAFAFEADGLAHVEPEKAVLRELAQRVLVGERVSVLARELNERGLTTPTGGRWEHGTLRKMLERPRYAGLLPDGVTAAAWEPLYDDDRDKAREIWESVCAVLQHRAAAFDYVTNARRYLLTGIAVCGSCEQPVAIRHNTRSENLRGYGCVNPACGRKVHRKLAHVDAFVIGAVLELLGDEEFVAALAGPDDDGVAAEITMLTTRRAETEMQLRHLVDHPSLDPGLLAASLASFDQRIEELRGRLALSARRKLLLRYAGISRAGWDDLPLETRRALVAGCFRVTIVATGRRGPGFDPESVLLDPVED